MKQIGWVQQHIDPSLVKSGWTQ